MMRLLRQRPVSLSDFPRWLENPQGLLPASIVAYDREVKDFIAHAGKRPRKGYTPGQVELWIMERGGAASTVTRRLSALKSYFKFTHQPDATAEVTRPKRRLALPRPVENLASKIEGTPQGFQWTCIFTASTGLRVSELCSEDGNWFRVIDGDRILVHGKGAKERVVPLDESARCAWAMLGEKIPYSVRDFQEECKERGFSPHQLRHLFATSLLERGVDVLVISKLLGHASVATTQRYCQVSYKQLAASMNGEGK